MTTIADPIHNVLQRLHNVKQTSNTQWQARCPSHDDRVSSLCVGVGDQGHVLVKCQAGCSTPDVLQAAGLQYRDLFNPSADPGPRNDIVATYGYCDEDGNLLFQVCRKANKDFPQRRPDGKGGWIWTTKGSRKVLYRLPELLAADPAGWVFVVEGEKDVDNLRSVGLVATCNPGGAGKWDKADQSALRGRKVCIIPDNDDPGRAHAGQVARSLIGVAADVRTLSLPGDGKDASDWLADDHGSADDLGALLISLADAAPAWATAATADLIPVAAVEPVQIHIRSARQLMADFPELHPPLIHGLLRYGETMNIIAPQKRGKSWLTLMLGLSVATGRRWLNQYRVEPGRVLILDNELHGPTSSARLPHVANAMGISEDEYADTLHVANLRGNLVDLHRTLAEVERIVEPGHYSMIGLDAFYRFIPTGVSENDNASMASMYNTIDRTAERLGCAFVLIHHTSKGGQADKSVTDVGSGAGAQSRAADTHLVLRDHEEQDAVVLEAACRSWPSPDPLCLRWLYPIWRVDHKLNPANLRQSGGRRKKEKPEKAEWTMDRFAREFVTAKPKIESLISVAAEAAGLTDRKAKRLLAAGVASGLFYRWQGKDRRSPVQYSTEPQPLTYIGD